MKTFYRTTISLGKLGQRFQYLDILDIWMLDKRRNIPGIIRKHALTLSLLGTLKPGYAGGGGGESTPLNTMFDIQI